MAKNNSSAKKPTQAPANGQNPNAGDNSQAPAPKLNIPNKVVKFKTMVRSSLGAFDRGQIYEIEGRTAEMFLKAGYCEEVK